jgi:hypothetical protein
MQFCFRTRRQTLLQIICHAILITHPNIPLFPSSSLYRVATEGAGLDDSLLGPICHDPDSVSAETDRQRESPGP